MEVRVQVELMVVRIRLQPACLAYNAPGIASGWITGDNRWSLGFPALQSRSAQTQEKGRR